MQHLAELLVELKEAQLAPLWVSWWLGSVLVCPLGSAWVPASLQCLAGLTVDQSVHLLALRLASWWWDAAWATLWFLWWMENVLGRP